MLHQSNAFFGDTQKMMARAMYDAGQSDTEIGLALAISVNNIIHWRRDAGLPEHRPAGEEAYSPPVERAAPARTAGIAADFRRDDGLLTPTEAKAAYVAPVQPTGDAALEIGTHMDAKVFIDLEELLTTRLLVQGNSGSGKSHLLRRVIEESTGIVQQVIIDPEGDFVGLAETFAMTVVHAHSYKLEQMEGIGLRTRQHRGSVVLNLEALECEDQMMFAAAFINGLFNAPAEYWFPALVFVDEAQLFAPQQAGEEDRETRKASLGAMTNLMCRGRKRGLAGVLATQRIAKLHKSVAGEASNFLMGRTFLDIDIARAGDLLGLQPRNVEQIRDLNRGEFLGLGPAISRRPLKVKVGEVMTKGRSIASNGIVPLPSIGAEELASLLLPEIEEEAPAVPALRVVK